MADVPMLNAVWAPPANGGAPKRIVVLLHGLSGTGGNTLGMSNVLAKTMPDTAFLAPDAPAACDQMYWNEETGEYYNPGGFQWTSLADRRPKPVWDGLAASFPLLDNFLDVILGHFNLDDSRLGIVGFSQGAMMAIHTGLYRANSAGAVVAMSGRILPGPGPGEDLNLVDTVAPKSRPPMLLIHGRKDYTVPFEQLAYTSRRLRDVGVAVEQQVYGQLAHSVTERTLRRAARYLNEKIAK